MRQLILLLFAFFLYHPVVQSQAVHYFHCVEVMEGGEVMLDWEEPGNEPEFVAYEVFFRIPPAAFTLIETITDYNISTYTHSTSVAKQQSVEYFILTERLTIPREISDTLKSIHLTVDNSNSSLAVLDWNAMHEPLLSSSQDFYNVMSHNIQGTFSLVGSTQDLHFEAPVTSCWDTLFFKIEIGDANGCLSVSNINSAEFRDDSSPPIPSMDSVSINPFTGEVILGWGESPAGDAGGYVVYHVMTNKNDTLDFIFGKQNTDYLDDSFDPCTENRSYALSAFDTCINISPGSYDIPQRTILFNEVIFNPCEMNNSLSWTEYINMNPTLEGYRVYLSVDGGSFEILATVSSGTTSYLHEGLDAGHSYQYFIRAFSVGNTVTSTSCFRDLTTWQYRQPIENEISNTSVVNNEMVSIILWPDTHASVPALNVYRSETENGSYDLIAEIDLFGEDELFYDDLTADVNSQSYYYKSSISDSCGNEVLLTDYMRTILLQGEQQDFETNMLSWNAFEGWPSGVGEYRIYRAINNNGNLEMIGSTNPSSLSYEDNVAALSGDFSLLRYVVKAIDAADPDRQSYSNEIFFEYTPSLYLPNAFTPGGQNPIFRPVGTFAEFSEYRMDVYNRWGELLFTSKDFETGWDGTLNGNAAPVGVYVCVISYRSSTGLSDTLKSTFVLVR